MYHIYVKNEVRFTLKSQKINKTLTKLFSKDVDTVDGQQKL